MKGGKIIRTIGGESVKTAKKSMTFTATHDNLTFNSATKVEMLGQQGGVKYFNDYKYIPLRVVKVDGPFDSTGKKVSVIEKGVAYIYKVIEFTRTPKEYELKELKWATQLDNQEVVAGYLEYKGKKEFLLRVPKDFNYSTLRVYAFFSSVTDSANIKTGIEKHICDYIDVTIVADYITKEMNTNIRSTEAALIKHYNHEFWWGNPFKVVENKKMAYKLWKDLVAAKKDWDHKGILLKMQNSLNFSCNKNEKEALAYNYDIWSNIHYGFVGKHIGFLETELLNGAGYAQIGDNNKKLNSWDTWKEYLKNRTIDLGDGDILGGFDDPSDQQAIKIGFRLYDKHKEDLDYQHVLEEIQTTLTNKKPLTVKKCDQPK